VKGETRRSANVIARSGHSAVSQRNPLRVIFVAFLFIDSAVKEPHMM
jgi:hypothetical protein